jgi:hypothetical protein
VEGSKRDPQPKHNHGGEEQMFGAKQQVLRGRQHD